jgi:hypothetical protein
MHFLDFFLFLFPPFRYTISMAHGQVNFCPKKEVCRAITEIDVMLPPHGFFPAQSVLAAAVQDAFAFDVDDSELDSSEPKRKKSKLGASRPPLISPSNEMSDNLAVPIDRLLSSDNGAKLLYVLVAKDLLSTESTEEPIVKQYLLRAILTRAIHVFYRTSPDQQRSDIYRRVALILLQIARMHFIFYKKLE